MSIYHLALNDETIVDIEANIYYYKGGMVHFEVEGGFQVASINVEEIKTIMNEDYKSNIKLIRVMKHTDVREQDK